MAVGVEGVEVDQRHRLGAGGLHLRDSVIAARVVREGGQDDVRRRVSQIALAYGEADLGRPAE